MLPIEKELSALSLSLAEAITASDCPFCVVTSDTLTATRLGEALGFFAPDVVVLSLPDWETLPYDFFSPHRDIVSERLRTLYRLPTLKKGVLIASVTTLAYRLCAREYLAAHVFLLQEGDHTGTDALRLRLASAGYRCVREVREHGEFAIRGSIFDLFPMGSETPFRIDFFEDTVESIRLFSPETQLTTGRTKQVELLPAHEFPLNPDAIELFRQQWRNHFAGNPLDSPLYQDVTEGIPVPGLEYYLPLFFRQTSMLTDWLPAATRFVVLPDCREKAAVFQTEIQHRYEQRRHDRHRPLLPPSLLFVSPEDIFSQLQKNPFALRANTAPLPPDFRPELPGWKGRILFSAETPGRRELFLQQLRAAGYTPQSCAGWQDFLTGTAREGMVVSPLEKGVLQTSPPMILITESDWTGREIVSRRRQHESPRDRQTLVESFTDLAEGTLAVHADHGIGRYRGLKILEAGGVTGEFLCLEYAGGDLLYVPVHSLFLVSRYSGMPPDDVVLDRLGTGQWQRARKKALADMQDIAAELLAVHAKRHASQGMTFQLPDADYAAFAAAFPFEETPDQQKAIDAILSDLESGKPMDRLVCGDVGFGKTEVAMRAAFMAVQNGRQTAVLVPTTLLASQHYQNFLDRFADWPVRIEMLSRFRTPEEQRNTLENLKTGKTDIVIGTHRLLQKNIAFHALGLVIVDEEHRFGVQQKEKLKALRANVHLLTLTATPIPRTLNMAFSGMRDLSLIATPPEHRLSVKTFVQPHDPSVIQEAILREIFRGGQVYFLHNDVTSIERTAREIAVLVPEAKTGIVHGQVRERELERIMTDFYHRHFNVLVCTTIIESGIDIPSANTIIINRADRLGLAQLHQLRGRVGRSHHQAYAWLLTPPRELLTAEATRRLEAIVSLEELGAGFTLATHDLEIRGAGELLGEGQSGNLQAMGFSLYMEMLEKAVRALQSGETPNLTDTLPQGTEINLQIPALIPDSYLDDVALRLVFYRKIAAAQTAEALDTLQAEMTDRFGELPVPLRTLFAQALLRQQAEKLGIQKLEAHAAGGKMEFTAQPAVEPLRIIQLIQTQPARFRLQGPTCLRFTLPAHAREDRLGLVREILESLQ